MTLGNDALKKTAVPLGVDIQTGGCGLLELGVLLSSLAAWGVILNWYHFMLEGGLGPLTKLLNVQKLKSNVWSMFKLALSSCQLSEMAASQPHPFWDHNHTHFGTTPIKIWELLASCLKC
jgi:hypothetical protein